MKVYDVTITERKTGRVIVDTPFSVDVAAPRNGVDVDAVSMIGHILRSKPSDAIAYEKERA